MRWILAVVGLFAACCGALVSVLFGYLGMLLMPIVLVGVYKDLGGMGRIVTFDQGVRDWRLFLLYGVIGNVMLGYCLGAVVDLLRKAIRAILNVHRR